MQIMQMFPRIIIPMKYIIMNNQPQPNNNIIINENDSINEVGERENPQQINNPQINSKIY